MSLGYGQIHDLDGSTAGHGLGAIDYRVIDVDNHYYESRDAFSRHIEARYAEQALHVVGEGPTAKWVCDGREVSYYPEDPAEGCPAPGSRSEFFAGDISLTRPVELCRPHDMPALMQRDARLDLLDEQKVEAIVQLPTVGVLFEPDIDDVDVLYANIRSFNRWIEEEWGYGQDERIFGIPILSLADLDTAVAEVERLADRGARGFVLKLGPVGDRSPADPFFDPFWARVEERGLLTLFHVGNNGYPLWFAKQWGETTDYKVRHYTAFMHYSCLIDRPTSDTLASLILNNLFGRFPGLRMMTVELGSAWVAPLLKLMDKSAKMAVNARWMGGPLTDRPSTIFREHIWVSPFHEDDMEELIGLIGSGHVLAGSDYPHGEGLADPLAFAAALDGFPADVVRKVMRSNAAGLLGLAP